MNLKDIGVNKRNCANLVQNKDYLRVLVNGVLNLRVL